MGLLHWFTGNQKADPNIAPSAPAAMKAAILSLNSDALPWRVVAGGEGEPDLIASWKFDDPHWRDELAKALMLDSTQMLMRLDVTSNTVRAVDQYIHVDLHPTSFSMTVIREQENKVGRSFVFGRKADGKFGILESHRFSTGDFKVPIRRVVADHGWSWRGVIFARL